jgi:hypothetical protein
MQIDWASCGKLLFGECWRVVYAFIAVLCFSRMIFVKFSLSQSMPHFLRAIQEALAFFGGSTKRLIFDNLATAVSDGHGRSARFHPLFLAFCGHYCLQPIACERSDPESKGVVEGSVRYLKNNALAGRSEQLQTFQGYLSLAPYWRDQVANPRIHATTREPPIDRFSKERHLLRHLPPIPFVTDDDVPAVVTPHCRVRYDTNRYSVPPDYARRPVAIRSNDDSVWVLFDGKEIARHPRCWEKRQILCLPQHRLAALQRRRRAGASQAQTAFDSWGPLAQAFHLKLLEAPVKSSLHIRKLLALGRLYGRRQVLTAIAQALQAQIYDAAAVENLLHQSRRKDQLPSPLPPQPKRRELIEQIELPEPDPGLYDRLFQIDL